MHFVPLDARLHNLHSTPAYFAGLNGAKAGDRVVDMEVKVKHGELTVERGREWTNKALRKIWRCIFFLDYCWNGEG